ncbi:Uncharacterised protein [Mycobacteroides abscessus]|nr:Uncharacterised protein [Mycobacteroides abscessus]CPX14513.1 Uncharacterised protein [Mycobacteroides abscessus]CPZ99470.1 Uncharacterised protein [Mycobacteroides abscessus]
MESRLIRVIFKSYNIEASPVSYFGKLDRA